MDSTPLAERIDRFIRQVDNFLSYDFAERVVLKTAAPIDEIEAAHERRMDARDAMRDDGRQLAQELVSAGYDPETVLHLLYAIDRGGGGARTLKRRWPQGKVTLQKLALQMQAGRSELAGVDRTAEEGDHTRRHGKKSRGRPAVNDPKRDKKLYEDWKASGLSAKEFATARGLHREDVEAAAKRHRQRLRRGK